MRLTPGLTIVALLVSAPAFAQKITIDYDHAFDFDGVKTFAYVDTEKTDFSNEMMDKRIADAVVRELIEGGLKQVDADPDLYVTYHVATKDNTVFDTTSFGYGGYGAGWGPWGGGIASSTTTARTYTEGTLIVDAYDAAEKKMVWRGTGTVTLKSEPDKQAKQVDNILKKMGARWDKILAKQGK